MTRDAIEGARYYDAVFDDEFVITNVESDVEEGAEPDEIDVTLAYEAWGEEMEVTLEQFREDDDIEVLSVPGDV